MADEPQDPEAEQQTDLTKAFLGLGFTQTEAGRLAACWADPARVAWWLEQGASHRQCVSIAT